MPRGTGAGLSIARAVPPRIGPSASTVVIESHSNLSGHTPASFWPGSTTLSLGCASFASDLQPTRATRIKNRRMRTSTVSNLCGSIQRGDTRRCVVHEPQLGDFGDRFGELEERGRAPCFVEVDRPADTTLDERDIDAPAPCRDDDCTQMKQRNRGAPANAQHALLAPEQALLAIEHELAAQRPEQHAHEDADAADQQRPQRLERDHVDAAGGHRPAGPRGRAREVELDARRSPLADLHAAEPIEHGESVRPGGPRGYYGASPPPPPPLPPPSIVGGG